MKSNLFLIFIVFFFNANTIAERNHFAGSSVSNDITFIDDEQNIWFFGERSREITKLDGLTNIVAVSNGGDDSLVLLSDGLVYRWEYNNNLEKINIDNAVDVFTSSNNYMVLKHDGTVVAWGDNEQGKLGLGVGEFNKISVPQPIIGLNNVKSISIGGTHAVVLKHDGTVWSAGWNTVGQLGNGGSGLEDSTIFKLVDGLNDIKSISTGHSFSLALKNDGTVWGWGAILVEH